MGRFILISFWEKILFWENIFHNTFVSFAVSIQQEIPRYNRTSSLLFYCTPFFYNFNKTHFPYTSLSLTHPHFFQTENTFHPHLLHAFFFAKCNCEDLVIDKIEDQIQKISEITNGGHIQIHVSKYGTSWALASTSHTTTGQYRAQNVLKEIKGLTPYAKKMSGIICLVLGSRLWMNPSYAIKNAWKQREFWAMKKTEKYHWRSLILLLILFMQEYHTVALMWITVFCGIIHGVVLFSKYIFSQSI